MGLFAHKKIRVLVVDDSALVRDILKKGLNSDPDIEVIGTAIDPFQARDILVEQKPDVITLDIEMPKMDGVTFLKKYMSVIPTPTIIISSLTEKSKKISLEAMEAGAVDVVAKPKAGVVDGLPAMMNDLIDKVKIASTVNVARFAKSPEIQPIIQPTINHVTISRSLDESTDRVIGIGISTGGTEALARIMPIFPPNTPGMVIVQHMPQGFTKSLSMRLNGLSQMEVKEAEEGDRIMSGRALLAPGGNLHMVVIRSGGQYRIKLIEGIKVSGHCPSVDVLFKSIGQEVGKNAIAVLMTGMGKDGAQGLLEIRNAGGRTFSQDEKSSVVYGMPRVGWELGASEAQVPLEKIPFAILNTLK